MLQYCTHSHSTKLAKIVNLRCRQSRDYQILAPNPPPSVRKWSDFHGCTHYTCRMTADKDSRDIIATTHTPKVAKKNNHTLPHHTMRFFDPVTLHTPLFETLQRMAWAMLRDKAIVLAWGLQRSFSGLNPKRQSPHFAACISFICWKSMRVCVRPRASLCILSILYLGFPDLGLAQRSVRV